MRPYSRFSTAFESASKRLEIDKSENPLPHQPFNWRKQAFTPTTDPDYAEAGSMSEMAIYHQLTLGLEISE